MDIWDDNLLYSTNENKNGKPYYFPDFLLIVIGYMRIYIFIYPIIAKQKWGIIKDTGKNLLFINAIRKSMRVNKLTISNMRSDDNSDSDDKGTIIARNSTVVSR